MKTTMIEEKREAEEQIKKYLRTVEKDSFFEYKLKQNFSKLLNYTEEIERQLHLKNAYLVENGMLSDYIRWKSRNS